MIKPPDYQYWCNRDLWTAWQSILLLLKVQPGKNLESSLDRYYPSSQTLWDEFRARIAMVRDAMDIGTLQPYNGMEFHNVHEYRRLRPKEFLKWAQGKGWDIPRELIQLLEVNDHDATDDEINASHEDSAVESQNRIERRLLIIEGVILGLGYNPKKIPTGGKQEIKNACLKDRKHFTESTFDYAWKAARRRELVKMAEHNKFRSG